MTWQARCAVLSALATYLHASPSVQRAAVRKWEPVAALFGLLWDDNTRRIALSMVCLASESVNHLEPLSHFAHWLDHSTATLCSSILM